MFMLGVLGEYIWRGLDESRRRPRYLIEGVAGGEIAVEPEPHSQRGISSPRIPSDEFVGAAAVKPEPL